MRNWPAGVSWCEIEVFNPQAWELAGIESYCAGEDESNNSISAEEFENYLDNMFLPYVRNIVQMGGRCDVVAQDSSFQDFCECLHKTLQVTKNIEVFPNVKVNT